MKKVSAETMRWIICAVFALVFVAGCQAQGGDTYAPEYTTKSPVEEKWYIFGVHPLHNPERLFQVYGPMVDYINARVSGFRLRLEASRNYDEYDKKLYAGHFDLALPNPYQTVNAQKHGYRVFGKMGDDENFKGIIVIRKDSGIEKVPDLKGKAVSFPAATALAATMMPQYLLHTNGIDINKDIKVMYVGSQESSIMNVYLGTTAAGATWPIPWRTFTKERPEVAKELIVKWETEALINNSLMTKTTTPSDVVEKVGGIIFAMQENDEGRTILARMPISRFDPATDKSYEIVRDYIRKFSQTVRPVNLE